MSGQAPEEIIAEQYPEHDKLRAVKDRSQICGDFLGELDERGIRLCVYIPGSVAEYVPIPESREVLLAKVFGIDLQVLEAEKRAMLETLRKGIVMPCFQVEAKGPTE